MPTCKPFLSSIRVESSTALKTRFLLVGRIRGFPLCRLSAQVHSCSHRHIALHAVVLGTTHSINILPTKMYSSISTMCWYGTSLYSFSYTCHILHNLDGCAEFYRRLYVLASRVCLYSPDIDTYLFTIHIIILLFISMY